MTLTKVLPVVPWTQLPASPTSKTDEVTIVHTYATLVILTRGEYNQHFMLICIGSEQCRTFTLLHFRPHYLPERVSRYAWLASHCAQIQASYSGWLSSPDSVACLACYYREIASCHALSASRNAKIADRFRGIASHCAQIASHVGGDLAHYARLAHHFADSVFRRAQSEHNRHTQFKSGAERASLEHRHSDCKFTSLI